MTRYFAGNTLASFFRTNVSIVEITTAGRFDDDFVPSAVAVPNGTDYIETSTFAASGTVWTHFDFNPDDDRADKEICIWRNAGVNVAKLHSSVGTGGMGFVKLSYWNGSAFVDSGATFPMDRDVIHRLDIRIDLNSGFKLYKAGTLITEGSGWTGGQTAITSIRFASPSTLGGYCFYSQVLVANFDTRDSRYFQLTMNGNSAVNVAGTGAYTDINETVLDEGTAEVVLAAADKMGQVYADITVPVGYVVGAVVVNARGRIAGTITDGKLGIRSGGTNYSGSGKTYNTGYEPRCRIDETNPNTSASWTEAGVNAAETYIEAV